MPWRAAADSGSEAVGRFKAGRFRNGGNVHTLFKKQIITCAFDVFCIKAIYFYFFNNSII